MLGVGPPESKDWTLSCEKGISLLFQYILRFFFDTALQKSGGGQCTPGPHGFDAPAPEFCSRFDHVSFDLENAIPKAKKDEQQKKTFYINSTGERHPLDWYNAFIEL